MQEAEHKSAVIRPDKDFKYPFFIMVFLFSLTLFGIGLLYYQISRYTVAANRLEEKIVTVNKEKFEITKQLEAKESEYSELVGIVNSYLKLQNINCISRDIKKCLPEESVKVLRKECSTTKDGVCGQWCTKEIDYDCCLESEGFFWANGKCLSPTPTPRSVPYYFDGE